MPAVRRARRCRELACAGRGRAFRRPQLRRPGARVARRPRPRPGARGPWSRAEARVRALAAAGRCRDAPPARPARAAMNCLTMRSSSEWKVTTTSRPPGRRTRSAACERPHQLAELVVDGDAQRLERRASPDGASGSAPARRAGDELGELRRGLRTGCRAAPLDDRARDRARAALLAVEVEDVGELALSEAALTRSAALGAVAAPCACRAGRRGGRRSRAPARRAASRRRRCRARRRRRGAKPASASDGVERRRSGPATSGRRPSASATRRAPAAIALRIAVDRQRPGCGRRLRGSPGCSRRLRRCRRRRRRRTRAPSASRTVCSSTGTCGWTGPGRRAGPSVAGSWLRPARRTVRSDGASVTPVKLDANRSMRRHPVPERGPGGCPFVRAHEGWTAADGSASRRLNRSLHGMAGITWALKGVNERRRGRARGRPPDQTRRRLTKGNDGAARGCEGVSRPVSRVL